MYSAPSITLQPTQEWGEAERDKTNSTLACEMRELDGAIQRLQFVVSETEAKLAPVCLPELRPEATCQSSEPSSEPRPLLCDLGTAIRSAADRVRAITDRIEGLHHRCQV